MKQYLAAIRNPIAGPIRTPSPLTCAVASKHIAGEDKRPSLIDHRFKSSSPAVTSKRTVEAKSVADHLAIDSSLAKFIAGVKAPPAPTCDISFKKVAVKIRTVVAFLTHVARLIESPPYSSIVFNETIVFIHNPPFRGAAVVDGTPCIVRSIAVESNIVNLDLPPIAPAPVVECSPLAAVWLRYIPSCGKVIRHVSPTHKKSRSIVDYGINGPTTPPLKNGRREITGVAERGRLHQLNGRAKSYKKHPCSTITSRTQVACAVKMAYVQLAGIPFSHPKACRAFLRRDVRIGVMCQIIGHTQQFGYAEHSVVGEIERQRAAVSLIVGSDNTVCQDTNLVVAVDPKPADPIQ